MNQKLISWSENNYSHLPWRVNRSLYNTLVSEIMLQQTTVGTVLKHFERFINKYPTINSLASISEEQMLIEWKGLGYYRRARSLLGAVNEVCDKFAGEIPLDFDQLLSIKGIGPYTASAILAIGADIPALAVDANLERVLSRFYGIDIQKGPKLQSEISNQFRAGSICTDIEKFGARDFNEALMDLGRSICKARSAACEICPLSLDCMAFKSGSPLNYPKPPVEKSDRARASVKSNSGIPLELLRVIVEENGKLLAYKKDDSEWLSNQYEIPTFIIDTEDEKLSQYPHITPEHESLRLLPSFRTGITKYKIDNYVIHMSFNEFKKHLVFNKKYVWIEDRNHISTSSQKALKLL